MAWGLSDTKNEATEAVVPTGPHEVPPELNGKQNGWLRFMMKIGWYSKDMSTEEKQLVLKLDFSILVFGCLSFFTKYLDQQSLTNAYVRLVLSNNLRCGGIAADTQSTFQWHERRDWSGGQ
jgi:ACS family pantothenate transporter-like MFS transporter